MLPQRKPLTLYDLNEMDDDNRYELIDGELYLLAAPRPAHTIISSSLLARIHNFLGKGPCQVFHAPADVYLFNQPEDSGDAITTIVQPDLFVICDPRQIGERGFFGPPKLAVEILSPSTAGMDRFVKYHQYQRAGVEEYWIVDPKNKIVSIYPLTDGLYGAGEAFSSLQTLRSETFPGLEIPLQEIFPEGM